MKRRACGSWLGAFLNEQGILAGLRARFRYLEDGRSTRSNLGLIPEADGG